MAQAEFQPATEAASSPPQKTLVSVFDLDRTLTILPTYTPFLLFAMRRRAPWRLLLLPALLPVALLYVLKLIPRRSMKQAMHRLALGGAVPASEANELADSFALHLKEQGLYAEGIALIDAERQAGRRIIMATAAPQFYAAAIARQIGITDVVATASTWHDEHLTPALASVNCYGPAKREMVEAFLPQAGIAPHAVHIRFYSDHASDLPMFELADEPFAVNPSAKLRTIAAERGWPVLEWRP